MPAAQVERLSQLIHEVMKDPDTRRKFEATKLEPWPPAARRPKRR